MILGIREGIFVLRRNKNIYEWATNKKTRGQDIGGKRKKTKA